MEQRRTSAASSGPTCNSLNTDSTSPSRLAWVSITPFGDRRLCGSVEQGSDHIGFDGSRDEASRRTRGKNALKLACYRGLGWIRVLVVAFRRVGERNLDGQGASSCGQQMLDVTKQQRTATVLSNVVIWSACKAVSSGTAVHPDATTPRNTATPAGMVVSQDGNPRARIESASHGPRPPTRPCAGTGVGAALHPSRRWISRATFLGQCSTHSTKPS